jgi:N-acetylneuraminic acid mutarotase
MNKIVPALLVFFFIIGTFAAVFNPVSAAELIENTWNTKAPMNQARANLGVVAVNGKIYAIGGQASIDTLDTNECYDPVMDTWATLKPIPTPRAYFAITACQDKIYCISEELFGGTEVYDIATNNWNKKNAYTPEYP